MAFEGAINCSHMATDLGTVPGHTENAGTSHIDGRTADLRAEQAKREEEAKARAIAKLRAALQAKSEGGYASDTGLGQAAVRGHMDVLTAAIRWAAENRRPVSSYGEELAPNGRPCAYADLLPQLPANVVAVLTLKQLVDAAVQGGPKGDFISAASGLGTVLEREAMVREFARLEGKFVAECAAGFQKRGYGDQEAAEALLTQMREKASVEWTRWDARTRRLLALDLLTAAMAHSGLFERALVKTFGGLGKKGAKRVKTRAVIGLSDAGREWWQKHAAALELYAFECLPMVCEPVRWTGAWGGGYVSPEAPIMPLVKTQDRAYLRSLKADQLADVLDAVNTIQSTAWRINTPVYSAALKLWQANGNTAGLPARSLPDALPPRCPDNATPEQIHARNKEAYRVYVEQTRAGSKAWRVDRALQIAEDVCSREAIWFPYQLDFRGRLYPMVPVLNPQGTDLEKALLHFAEGKPLGSEEAACWLAIHGANCFGKDKLPLQERIDWVAEHEEQIKGSAADPVAHDFWKAADSPFQFLAFCFEWAAYLRHEGDPATFVSHLPVSLDGTCNGLQHLSAMTRDERGGTFVNLSNHDKPADIYARVAERVAERLLEIAGATESEPEDRRRWAKGWLEFGICRKITKRVVMVVPYGGTTKACRDYVRQAVADLAHAGRPLPFARGRDLLDGSTMLSNVVWESLADVLSGARRTMKWLQACARLLAKEGKPMRWTAPSGFPVLMNYKDTRNVFIEYGPRRNIFKGRFRQELTGVNSYEQGNGASPNYTHSMDAAHLILTVNTAAAYGVTAWAAVHDSYGTHAADVPILTQALRKVFAHIYHGDPLAALEAEIKGQLNNPDKCPPRPAYGNWNPDAVLDAEFFFH